MRKLLLVFLVVLTASVAARADDALSLSQALNVAGGTLNFSSTGDYPRRGGKGALIFPDVMYYCSDFNAPAALAAPPLRQEGELLGTTLET